MKIIPRYPPVLPTVVIEFTPEEVQEILSTYVADYKLPTSRSLAYLVGTLKSMRLNQLVEHKS